MADPCAVTRLKNTLFPPGLNYNLHVTVFRRTRNTTWNATTRLLAAHHAISPFFLFSSLLFSFLFLLEFKLRAKEEWIVVGKCGNCFFSYFFSSYYFSFLQFKFPANRRGTCAREWNEVWGGKEFKFRTNIAETERDDEKCGWRVLLLWKGCTTCLRVFTDILSGWKVTRRHYGNRSSWETISCTVNVASFSPLSWQCTMWPEYILLRWMRFLVCTYIRGPFE